LACSLAECPGVEIHQKRKPVERPGKECFPGSGRQSQERLISFSHVSFLLDHPGLFSILRPFNTAPFDCVQRLSMKKLHMRYRVMPPAFFSVPGRSRLMPKDAWRLLKCLDVMFLYVFDMSVFHSLSLSISLALFSLH